MMTCNVWIFAGVSSAAGSGRHGCVDAFASTVVRRSRPSVAQLQSRQGIDAEGGESKDLHVVLVGRVIDSSQKV